jgi:hypothetical protein
MFSAELKNNGSGSAIPPPFEKGWSPCGGFYEQRKKLGIPLKDSRIVMLR